MELYIYIYGPRKLQIKWPSLGSVKSNVCQFRAALCASQHDQFASGDKGHDFKSQVMQNADQTLSCVRTFVQTVLLIDPPFLFFIFLLEKKTGPDSSYNVHLLLIEMHTTQQHTHINTTNPSLLLPLLPLLVDPSTCL